MSKISKALTWAAAILVVAGVASFMDLSDGSSFALVTALSVSALASIRAEGGCGRSCLQ